MIEHDDQRLIEEVLELSRKHRILAPLALAVGGLAIVLQGMRLLFSNWRLALVQVLPAAWIWAASYNLKAHLLHGRSFHVLTGPVLIPIALVIVAITTACFFLNAVFAFAITGPPPPSARRGFAAARERPRPVLVWGAIVGLLLAFATTVVTRWGGPWFAISLGVVVVLMSFCYVAVPARMVGVRVVRSRRDKVAENALTGLIGTMVCTPPNLLARAGILMLGSHALFVPGLIVLSIGATMQAGATGAVRAIKFSSSLITGHPPPGEVGLDGEPRGDPPGERPGVAVQER